MQDKTQGLSMSHSASSKPEEETSFHLILANRLMLRAIALKHT